MHREFAGKRFLVWTAPLLTSVLVLLLVVIVSLDMLSVGRAIVGGEGYWSKAQKDAVSYLLRYARTFDPADFAQYRAALAVPLGARKAREALDRPDPDYEAARKGLVEGRNDPGDVDGMARFFVRFRNVSYVARAIDLWAEGDREIALLQGHADRLRDEVESGRRDPAQIGRLLEEIRRCSQRLTPLEDGFSQTLGEASRILRDVLVVFLVCVAVLVTGGAMLVFRRMLKRAESAEAALRRATRSLARHAEQMQFIAHHDTLTGLPNRMMFERQAQQVLSRTRRHGRCAALLFIDLDGFKAVNDARGHAIGDELLRAVGARLGAHVRKEDVAARFGGDEFCVILDALSGPDAAELASRHLVEVLGRPYTIGTHDLTVTASIGIGCFPRDGETIEALLECADARMYREKRRPRIVSSRG